MKVKHAFIGVMIFIAVLSGLMPVAAGAVLGVCWKSVIVGILCVALSWVTLLLAAYSLYPKFMHDECDAETEGNERL